MKNRIKIDWFLHGFRASVARSCFSDSSDDRGPGSGLF